MATGSTALCTDAGHPTSRDTVDRSCSTSAQPPSKRPPAPHSSSLALCHLRGSLPSPHLQQHPRPADFWTFFAYTRMPTDAICTVLTLTVIIWAATARTLHTICACSAAPPTPAAAALHGCSPTSRPPPPMLWLPASSNPLHLLRPPPPSSPTPSLPAPFPCAASLPAQVLWVTRHFPLVLHQIFIRNASYGMPVAWGLALCSITTMLLRPQLYVRGARTLLVIACMLLPQAFSTAELLLEGPAGAHATRAFVVAMWRGTTKAPGIMLFMALVFPLPRNIQLCASLAHLALITATEALLLEPGASWWHVALFAACGLVLGVVLPCYLIQVYEQGLWAQYQGIQEQAHAAGAAPPGSAAAAAAAGAGGGEAPAPRKSCGDDAGYGEGSGKGGAAALLEGAPRQAAPVAGCSAAVDGGLGAEGALGEEQEQQQKQEQEQEQEQEQPQAGQAKGQEGLPPPQQQQQEQQGDTQGNVQDQLKAQQQQQQPPPQRQQPQEEEQGQKQQDEGAGPSAARAAKSLSRVERPYVSPLMSSGCLAVKVHHHGAFRKRFAIRDALEACLSDHLAATSAPTPPAASLARQLWESLADSFLGGEGPLADGPPATAGGAQVPYMSSLPEAQVAVALSTTMVRGCLQLLVSFHTLRAAAQRDGDGGGGGGREEGSGAGVVPQEGSGGVQNAVGREQLERAAKRGVAPLCAELGGCEATVSSVVVAPGGCGGLEGRVGLQGAHLGGDVALALVPACVEAGIRGAQEVGVEAAGVPGGVVGRQGLEVEVVASYWQGGERVTVRQPLRAVPGGGRSNGSCRLHLPPMLDAAPLELHLVATCPGSEGVLLAHLTTMALPRSTARELLAALPSPPTARPAIHAGLLRLLVDTAATWQLLRPRLAPNGTRVLLLSSVAAGRTCADHMSVYCTTERLPHYTAFLQSLLRPRATAAHPAACRPAAAPPAPTPAPPAAPPIASSAAPAPAAPLPASPAPQTPPVQPEPGSTAWERQYSAWALRQGRGVDLMAGVCVSLLWALFLGKEVGLAGAPWAAIPDMALYAAVDVLTIAGPWLVLAVGPEAVRQKRPWVIAVQAVLVGAKFLAAASCWLPQPSRFQQGDPSLSVLVVVALFVPTIQRVGWRQQLLSSFLLEEVPRYLMLSSGAACPDLLPGAKPLIAPSLAHAALLPWVAAMASWVVERRSRAAYARQALGAAAAAAAGSGKHKAD